MSTPKFDSATTAMADALAGVDGNLAAFRAGKSVDDYMTKAADLILRFARRGYEVGLK